MTRGDEDARRDKTCQALTASQHGERLPRFRISGAASEPLRRLRLATHDGIYRANVPSAVSIPLPAEAFARRAGPPAPAARSDPPRRRHSHAGPASAAWLQLRMHAPSSFAGQPAISPDDEARLAVLQLRHQAKLDHRASEGTDPRGRELARELRLRQPKLFVGVDGGDVDALADGAVPSAGVRFSSLPEGLPPLGGTGPLEPQLPAHKAASPRDGPPSPSTLRAEAEDSLRSWLEEANARVTLRGNFVPDLDPVNPLFR